MTWYPNLIKYRLLYYEKYKNYVKMWQPTVEYFGVPKRKRVSYDPLFVSQALENAMFDEVFDKLTDQEQQFLIMLYTDGAEDFSIDDNINILYSQDGFDEIMRTGLKPVEVWEITNGALGKMVDWLNKLEVIG